MPKISIYVPDDIKARMDRVGKQANWSAIAQTAFHVELEQIEATKEISTMEDVIERLRASKSRFRLEEISDARKCGADWAKNHAEFSELRRLTTVDTEGFDHVSGPEAAFAVYKHLVGEDPYDKDELANLYMIDPEAVDSITPEFVEGFVLGAGGVWEEIKDHI